MDIYVESNFVIEVAWLQEQHESCEKILELCELGNVNLIVPAYSLVEPYETVVRRAKNRTKISKDLASEVTQLLRTKPYQEEKDVLEQVTSFLVRSQQEEKERLRNTINMLLNVAQVIPLTSAILSTAITYQVEQAFSPQDAIVYASVLEHLNGSRSVSKCFLNRNSKDFDDPDIVDALSNYGCRMLFRFDHGYEYIVSQICR